MEPQFYFNYFRHVAMLQKFACGPVGAPVRPMMLNMPKSASDYKYNFDADQRILIIFGQ